MSKPSKREVLRVLSIKRLGRLCDDSGVPREGLHGQDALVDALATDSLTLPELLNRVPKKELKEICAALNLGTSGKKAALVARILGQPPASPPIPAEAKTEPQKGPAKRAKRVKTAPPVDPERPLELTIQEAPAPSTPPKPTPRDLSQATSEHLTIAPGAQILVRDAVWRVLQVNRTSTGKASWSVVGVSEIVRDQEAIFIEEYETSVKVLDPAQTALELDSSPNHRDSRLYLESLLRDVPPTSPALHIGHAAPMKVMDYQLEPTAKALVQLRQRVLIADAVGLGKTLEAGILLAELIRRGRGKRILVATVKSMLTQFQKEMWSRFTIPLVRLDSQGLHRIREHIPTNHNPFYHFDKIIISVDTLKQNNAFRDHVRRAWWDVIVIDEAHNVAVRGGARSQRARIAEILADRSDAMILLSATPHDGKARSFASLMNMLDPTAIANPDKYTRSEIEGLFVRRFKKDVISQIGEAFPEREIERATAPASPEEEAVYGALADLDFTALKGERDSGILYKISLEKALFSSPSACSAALTAPLRRPAVRALLPQGFFPRRRSDETRAPSEILAAAAPHLPPDLAGDIAQLHRLAERLEAIRPEAFSKYQNLLRTITERFRWTPSKRDDRLVIFSERIETLNYLRERLLVDLKLKEEQIEILHGALPDTDQGRIVEDFGKDKAKIRVLLASDVASEGINLHYLCHRMIHFDIPWSLMVFQQRNGRIDRFGQERVPQIVYMLTEAREEKIRGDTRILDLLIERDRQVSENIGDASEWMGSYTVEGQTETVASAIERGLSSEAFLAERESDPDTKEATGLEELLAWTEDGGEGPPPRKEPLSLFPSEFAYARAAVDRLAEVEGLVRTVRDKRGHEKIEIHMPPDTQASRRKRLAGLDLRKRFRKLPAEILPKDGVVVLSPDAKTVERAIAESRREESAWPRIQYLWPNNPVVRWLSDKGRAIFGRHCAPVITLLEGLKADEALVVISGLIPNRRSQPLVHRWFAVRFRGGEFSQVEDFGDAARQLKLAKRDLPNRNVPADLELLRGLIPEAVARTREAMLKRRERFQSEIDERLKGELAKLAELKARQLAELDARFADKPRHKHTHERRARRISRVFDRYDEWAKDSLTTEPVPFLQVLAVIRPETGFGGAA